MYKNWKEALNNKVDIVNNSYKTNKIQPITNEEDKDANKPVLNKINKEKADLIHKFRMDNKLTREQLAKLICINVKDLASMECGTCLKNKPEYNKVLSYINNYNIKQRRLQNN